MWLSSHPLYSVPNLISLQFLGFAAVFFSWSFWRRSLQVKGVLSKNSRHFGQTKITVVLLVPSLPIWSFILQLPFSHIFAVCEWFSTHNLYLDSANRSSRRLSPAYCVLTVLSTNTHDRDVCWAWLGFRYVFGKNPSWVMFCTSNSITVGDMKCCLSFFLRPKY